MTWKQLKTTLKQLGVKDHHEIYLIDIGPCKIEDVCVDVDSENGMVEIGDDSRIVEPKNPDLDKKYHAKRKNYD